MPEDYIMHVVPGTHWDREWRHTAEQSKPRLVDLIDTAMEVLETTPEYKCFCLDGGQVVLEDYLSVRPQNRERLAGLIRAGRIQLVHWYTLPELFTVAAEAVVRNLLLGREMAAEFGGTMRAGYTATSYGQPSQLPQIYAGFGIPNAMFYRGTNRYAVPQFFHWEAPDGTRIHMHKTFDEVTRTNWYFYVHQPLVLGKPPRDLSYTYDAANTPVHMCDSELYGRAFKLLDEDYSFRCDEESLRAAFERLLDQAKPYAVGNRLLALNMEDNDVPFAQLPEMITALNGIQSEVRIVQSSLDEYLDTVTEEAEEEGLEVFRGELRFPVVELGFNALLGATHASRPVLKLLNERAETGLIHQAEPLAAAAAMLGAEYPRANLDRAWRALLQNQAHDSICGAAVDRAHEDNLFNFSRARAVAEEITARSATELFTRLDTAGAFQPGDHTITLFNTLPFDREEVVPLVIDLPKLAAGGGVADPCTGAGAEEDADASADVEYYDIVDHDGNECACEELTKEDIRIAVERELDTSVRFPATRRRVLLKARVPAMGYATYALRPRGPRYVRHPETGPGRALIAREGGTLENEHLRVEIQPNGTFTLEHKATGRRMEKLHYFTDEGELGSAHKRIEPQRNPVETSLGAAARIRMAETNLLRGVFRIDLTLTVPAAATLDGRDRLTEERTIPVTTWLTLEKDSPCLKLHTRITNTARDHRLRLNFPAGLHGAKHVDVESAYAVEQRPIQWTQTGDNAETFYAFQPMQNFIDVSDGKTGLALLNRGIREYEVKDDRERTIAMTLLRTQRAYMTANEDMTPDEFAQHRGQHALGTLDYDYALYPHAGGWREARVLQAAYAHKVMMNAIQGLPRGGGTLPVTASFFGIAPADNLAFSAFKQSQDGSAYVLRFWNTGGEAVDAVIRPLFPVESAVNARLDETPLETLPLDGGAIRCSVPPHKVVTLLMTPAKR